MTHLPKDTPLSRVVDEGLRLLDQHQPESQGLTLVIYRSDHRIFKLTLPCDLYGQFAETIARLKAAVERLSPVAVAVVGAFHDPAQLRLPGQEHVALMAEDIDHQTYAELAQVENERRQLLGHQGRMLEVEGSLLASAVSAGIAVGVFS